MSVKKPFMTGVLLVGLFCSVFLLSFAVMSLVMKPQIAEAPVSSSVDVVPAVANKDVIGKHTTVKEEIYYSKCRHLETRTVENNQDYVGKTYAELESLGWQVYDADKSTVVVSKDMDAFCPEDDQKRHIAQCGDNLDILGIYRGPVNLNGELLEELPIKLADLPQDWQTQILNGGYEFKDEKSLDDALENLDELLYD